MSRSLPTLPGDRTPMTWRAKAYLWIGAARTWPVAAACFANPELFRSPAFEYLRSAAPIWGWGIVFVVSGLLSAAAAITSREWLARIALITSASITACWAIGFAFAAAKGNLVSPLGITWGLALAAKDLVVCRQPLWSPFEQMVSRIAVRDRTRPAQQV